MHRLSQLKASFESNTVKYKLKVSMIPAPKTEQPLCRLLQVPLLVCPVSVCLSVWKHDFWRKELSDFNMHALFLS